MADSKMAVCLCSPAFVQDLVPAAQKTALLYRLSYLCLASFPHLEEMIRFRAVETQLLFGSSDATMLKCILISKNLVQSLFPMLTKAVKKNKAILAVKFLGKAQVWIKEIISEVDRIVEKADAIYLTQKQWQLELQIFDWQMKIAKANFDRNSIPDPIHLNEVQSSLSKIQKILIRLKEFCEVAHMLKYLEQKTFVGEDLIEDLADLKDEFLESIEAAKEAWNSFGAGCKKASRMFKLQTKDAYKFLEVSPSSLSKEQWQTEYESVKEQLQKIDPVQSVMSSDTPAIS
ncbi:myosin heavy chain [Labeo rohita]|uniref:Myosin heavy chain n=1 Tax=Labeo rohita TaxID=84645 RepID=A0A498P1Q3_LABRO|nr:myosin heavy chain [Labeo rohita]